MITVQELKRKAERKYTDFLRWKINVRTLPITFECGEVTAPLGTAVTDFFPLDIKADTGNVTDTIASRSQAVAPLYRESKNESGRGYALDLETVVTRKNGNQSKIKKIYFETEDDYLYFIGRQRETERFSGALETVAAFFAEKNCTQRCTLWCFANLKALSENRETSFWSQIVSCTRWLLENPGSGLYIREIPLPVHTKFIENNKTLILSLFLCIQNADATETPLRDSDTSHLSERSFEQICELRRKPVQIRFRCKTIPFSEMTLDLNDFAELPREYLQGIRDIFIIENEIVYLTFPLQNDRLVVWGHGFTAIALGVCTWLRSYRLFYFGDLDEHGYQILSQFRERFPQTASFCMDKETLQEYGNFTVKGKVLAGKEFPPFLTEAETKIFSLLRSDPNHNRLEQERITIEYIQKQLALF